MSRYDSDDSSIVSERPRNTRPRQRQRSPSEDSYDMRSRRSERTERGQDASSSKNDKIGKVSIAVGLLLAGMLSIWTTKRSAEREREAGRKHRRDFARAKEARRRDESRLDRQRQQEWESESDDGRTAASSARRIAYPSRRSPSRSPPPRRIGAPPSARRSDSRGSAGSDRGYRDDARTRRG